MSFETFKSSLTRGETERKQRMAEYEAEVETTKGVAAKRKRAREKEGQWRINKTTETTGTTTI